MVAGELRYHVPRSQAWAGSRGAQAGNVHVHVLEEIAAGQFKRRRGEALCSKRTGWYERPPDAREAAEQRCETCEARAERYSVAANNVRTPA